VPKSTPLNPSNTPNKNLLLSPDAYLGNSTKRLVIKDGALTPKLKMRLQLTNGSHDGANGTPASKTPQAKNNPQPTPTPPTNSSLNYDGQSPIHPDNSSVQFDIPAETPHSMAGNSTPGTNGSSSMAQTSTKKTPPSSHKSNTSVDFYNQVVSSPSASTPVQNPAYMPRLLNSDYITSPPFSEIMSMGEVELATVKDFTMIHPSRGSIQWQGTVDIRGVDLDATVIIGDKEVAVYDDEDVQNKPEVGEKLNRPAIVTLYNITPTNDMAKFTKKLERVTKKMDAEFISYDPDEEVWCFRTKHFSRYGLGDDSDDEEDGVDTQAGGAVEKKTSVVASFQPAPPKPPSSVPLIKGLDFRSGDRGGRSPGPKLSPFVPTRRNFGDAVEDEDEVMDKANDAYGMILDEFMDVDGRTVTPVLEGSAGAEVSEAEERQWSKSKPYKPPLWKVKDVTPRGQGGICGRIRKEEGVSDKNVRDFQHFMGRGCRASFGPDGKLVTTGKDGRTVLIQAPAACAGEGRGDMFRVHSRHSLAEGEGEEALPMFRLPSGLANKGTSESYVSLLRCLDAYIDAFDGRPGGKSDVGRMGFVLVRALYGQEDAAYDATNPADLLPILPLDLNKVDVDRRAEGFKAFLREFVAEDVDALVKENRDRKPATAILAALLGDKTEEAIELAIENGYSRLATLLCSGFSCAEYMVEQLGSWADGLAKLDGELLRVYNLLAGKVSENEGLLYERGSRQIGWRIRLAAHMLCGLCGYGGERKTVIDAVGDYDSEVMRKTAPQPFPRWDEARRGDNGRKCLVYNLLRMYVSGGGRDGSSDSKLGEVLHPHGYSKNENDFSLGWHVGGILVSLGVTSRMSGEEALKFCSSYADDLVRNGEWEKAVYVLLCTKNFVREEEEEKTAEGARRMAEDVIMRNYGDGARGEGGRKWLEELGVKGKVFEEAIALAKGWKGDCIGLCKAAVNAGNIGLAVKNINLCKPLFVGGEDEANLHTLLGYLKEGGGEDVAGWSAVNGCGAVLAFLDLKEGLKTLVENYVMGEGRVGREEVEELLVCSESCSMLKDLEPSGYELSFVELAREGGDKERYKAFKAAVFAELASKVACLRLQLKSVVRGENIDVDKIGDIGDVGGLVLKQLEEEEGGMVDTTGKMGLELSALRVIASYLVAKF
jgi:nuclear pore complex protein Nup98-Nup96